VLKISPAISHLLLLLSLIFITHQPVYSQAPCGAGCKAETGVTVTFSGSIYTNTVTAISLGGVTSTGTGKCPAEWVETSTATATLEPEREYQLEVTGAWQTRANFQVPDGYVMEINGAENSQLEHGNGTENSGNGAWTVVFRRSKCGCGQSDMVDSDQDGDANEPGESEGLEFDADGDLSLSIDLGDLSGGDSAGSIELNDESIDNYTYTSNALSYLPPSNSSEVEVIKDSNSAIRQIRTPNTLVDVVTISANHYEIRFYNTSSLQKSGDLYSTPEKPHVTYRVRNPIANTVGKLELSKIEGEQVQTEQVSYDPVSGAWSLSEPGKVKTQTTSFDNSKNEYTRTTIVKNSKGEIVSHNVVITKTYAWGEEVKQEITDPAGADLRTTYSYFEDKSQKGRYGKIQSIVYPNGSWVKYDYDDLGNIKTILHPWKDLSFEEGNEGNSHVTIFTYSNFDGVFTQPYAKYVESVEEKIAGRTVHKKSYSRSAKTVNNELAVEVKETLHANESTSYRSATTNYYKTASGWLAGRQVSMETADGRLITNSYERGSFSRNENPELNRFSPSADGLAERHTTTFGTTMSPNGLAYKTLRIVTIYDQRGLKSFEETFCYKGGNDWERVGWTDYRYDSAGQLRSTTGHDGRVVSNEWQGTRIVSTTDEHGIQVDYTYDSLGRVEKKIKKGMQASNLAAAQPDIITIYGYDAEDRIISETIKAGDIGHTIFTKYDPAGRIESTTDAAGISTSYTYENGGLKQTTASGGSTQVVEKHLNGQVKSITGSGVIARHFTYGVNADGTRYTKEFYGPAGTSSPRTVTTTIDWLDRTIKIETPSNNRVLETIYDYNRSGQLYRKRVTSGGATLISNQLFEYDDYGVVVRAGLDVDNSGSLTPASLDRYTESESKFEKSDTSWFVAGTNRTFFKENDGTATATSIKREKLTGFQVNGSERTVEEIQETDISGNTTIATKVVDRKAKKSIERIDSPFSTTDAVNIKINGLLQSTTPASPQLPTTFTYDALGRAVTISSPDTGRTTKVYSPVTGQLISVTEGLSTITFEYYPAGHQNAGLLKSQSNSENKRTYFAYNRLGELTRTWGEAAYPVEYIYDGYGQRRELRTFRTGSGWNSITWPESATGPVDITRWEYDEATGLITKKTDAAGRAQAFKYDDLGRLTERRSARTFSGSPVTTTYSYHPAKGDLTNIDYSDNTTDLVFNSYDRAGRVLEVKDAAGTQTFSYQNNGELSTEQTVGGILNGIKISRGFDSGIRNSLQATVGGTQIHSQTYGLDQSGRLEKIIAHGVTSTYSYHPTRGLQENLNYAGGISVKREYDQHGRLESIKTLGNAAAILSGFSYAYNSLNQKTFITREDGSYWYFQYNDRGELTAGKKVWQDRTFVAGQQMEYEYDNRGNRKLSRSGGNSTGAGLVTSDYSVNELNQYTSRTIPGVVDIFGDAESTATVTVNNQATYRKGDYFHTALVFDNQAGPLYEKVEVTGAKSGIGSSLEDAVETQTGRIFIPGYVEQYQYDMDGNLLSDGRWNYQWNAENRLVQMESVSQVPFEARRRLDFVYDYIGRRVQKRVFVWNTQNSSYELQSTTRFVYDGWNLVAELDANNSPIRSYTWGTDLSGSLEGAGGIGGLILIRDGSNSYQVGYDGNGNISTLVRTGTNTVEAVYDYDPQGNLLRSTGDYASKNPFRFSTKYRDAETELVYFGLRYYNPRTGRWINRDPIGEDGGVNLYGFVLNNPASLIDPIGLDWWYDTKNVRTVGNVKVLPAPEFKETDPHGSYERWTSTGFGHVYWATEDGKWAALDPYSKRALPFDRKEDAERQVQKWSKEASPYACGTMSAADKEFWAGVVSENEPLPLDLVESLSQKWGKIDVTSRDYVEGQQIGSKIAMAAGGLGAARSILKRAGKKLTKEAQNLIDDIAGDAKCSVSGNKKLLKSASGLIEGSFFGKTPKQVLRNAPKHWRKVDVERGNGWKLLDENGVERVRFMRGNDRFSPWGRNKLGYWRRKNANDEFLDEAGNVVPDTDPDFQWKTHIPYTGPK
jgi:RHS repeat-associated protein